MKDVFEDLWREPLDRSVFHVSETVHVVADCLKDFDVRYEEADLLLPDTRTVYGEKVDAAKQIVSRIRRVQIDKLFPVICEQCPVLAREWAKPDDVDPSVLPDDLRLKLLGQEENSRHGYVRQPAFNGEQFTRAYVETGFDPRGLVLKWEQWAYEQGLHPVYPMMTLAREHKVSLVKSADIDVQDAAEPMSGVTPAALPDLPCPKKTTGKGRKSCDDITKAKYPEITKEVAEWMRLGKSEAEIVVLCEEKFWDDVDFSQFDTAQKKRDFVHGRIRWVKNHPNWRHEVKRNGQKGGKK